MDKLLSQLMFSYGFVPMLSALNHFEAIEDYETCNQIIQAVKRHGNNIDLELPTKYGKQALVILRNAFKELGVNGAIAQQILPEIIQGGQ